MQFNWAFFNIFRQDYVANEVTLDYNAGFQGAVGKLGGWFQGPLYDKMFLGLLHEFWRNENVHKANKADKIAHSSSLNNLEKIIESVHFNYADS